MRSTMAERLEVKRIASHRQGLFIVRVISLPAHFRPSIARVKSDLFGRAYIGIEPHFRQICGGAARVAEQVFG